MLRSLALFLFCYLNVFAQVDLNNATAEELLELNGIGEAKSQKIIAYREQHQCFKSVDELANIDGISEKILMLNKENILLGDCNSSLPSLEQNSSPIQDVLFDPVNLIFTFLMLLLAFLDIKTNKDFKSQIVSMGVLGTFVGIFIGLQAFNPNDIIHSVNDILLGLKTAFFTSIVGMSLSTILSIAQKFTQEKEQEDE
jgi:competence ComEA-like helix-hairpin-helix protein